MPLELEPAITWVSSNDESFSSCIYASAVSLGWLGVVSCYFPNPKDGSNERFMVAMHECRRVLDKMKVKGCQTFVVGCDLNVQLPSSIGDLTGPACCTLPDGADNRVNMTLSLLDDFGLAAINTFTDLPEFTRVDWKNKEVSFFHMTLHKSIISSSVKPFSRICPECLCSQQCQALEQRPLPCLNEGWARQ